MTSPGKVFAKLRAEARLAARCRRTLRNWQAVLWQIGANHAGWHRGLFTVTSRTGLTLQAPNHRTSWWPILDVLALDSYRLGHDPWGALAPPQSILIIGANVGSLACALGTQLPASQLVCVEPSPSTLSWLRENLRSNGLSDRSQVIAAALADQDGEVELWAPEDAFFAASLTLRDGPKVVVPGMTFASLMATVGGAADLVSMSCVGAELLAISDPYEDQWRRVRQLFLEYGPSVRPRFAELAARLDSWGLNLVWRAQDAHFQGVAKACFIRQGASSESHQVLPAPGAFSSA